MHSPERTPNNARRKDGSNGTSQVGREVQSSRYNGNDQRRHAAVLDNQVKD